MKGNFMKKSEKTIFIILVCSVFVVFSIMSITILYLCFMILDADSSVIGGAIGAVGSIVGGTVTLVGVRYTIKLQNRKEFIDKFPEKLLLSNAIYRSMEKLFSEIDDRLKRDNPYYLNLKYLHDEYLIRFLNVEFEQMRIDASKLGVEAFEIIMKFEIKLEELSLLMEEAQILQEGKLIKRNIIYPWRSSLEDYQYQLLLLTEELEQKYNSYSSL
jgi:hypothetical protein